jgi:hypothetical protein
MILSRQNQRAHVALEWTEYIERQSERNADKARSLARVQLAQAKRNQGPSLSSLLAGPATHSRGFLARFLGL